MCDRHEARTMDRKVERKYEERKKWREEEMERGRNGERKGWREEGMKRGRNEERKE